MQLTGRFLADRSPHRCRLMRRVFCFTGVGLALVLALLVGTAVFGAVTDTGGQTPKPVATAAGRHRSGKPGTSSATRCSTTTPALPDVAAVQAALDRIGGTCTAATCLRLDTFTPQPYHLDWCKDWAGPTGPAVRTRASCSTWRSSCGINPTGRDRDHPEGIARA